MFLQNTPLRNYGIHGHDIVVVENSDFFERASTLGGCIGSNIKTSMQLFMHLFHYVHIVT